MRQNEKEILSPTAVSQKKVFSRRQHFKSCQSFARQEEQFFSGTVQSFQGFLRLDDFDFPRP